MLVKIKYWLSVLCLFAGFFILIGSAGASDLNEISAEGFAVRGTIGLIILLVGSIGLRKGGYVED